MKSFFASKSFRVSGNIASLEKDIKTLKGVESASDPKVVDEDAESIIAKQKGFLGDVNKKLIAADLPKILNLDELINSGLGVGIVFTKVELQTLRNNSDKLKADLAEISARRAPKEEKESLVRKLTRKASSFARMGSAERREIGLRTKVDELLEEAKKSQKSIESILSSLEYVNKIQQGIKLLTDYKISDPKEKDYSTEIATLERLKALVIVGDKIIPDLDIDNAPKKENFNVAIQALRGAKKAPPGLTVSRTEVDGIVKAVFGKVTESAIRNSKKGASDKTSLNKTNDFLSHFIKSDEKNNVTNFTQEIATALSGGEAATVSAPAVGDLSLRARAQIDSLFKDKTLLLEKKSTTDRWYTPLKLEGNKHKINSFLEAYNTDSKIGPNKDFVKLTPDLFTELVKEKTFDGGGLFDLFAQSIIVDRLRAFAGDYSNNDKIDKLFYAKLGISEEESDSVKAAHIKGRREEIKEKNPTFSEDELQAEAEKQEMDYTSKLAVEEGSVRENLQGLINDPRNLSLFLNILVSYQESRKSGNKIKPLRQVEESLKKHKEDILALFDNQLGGQYPELRKVFSWFFEKQLQEFEPTLAAEVGSINMPDLATPTEASKTTFEAKKPADEKPIVAAGVLDPKILAKLDPLDALPGILPQITPTTPRNSISDTVEIEKIDLDLARILSFFSENPQIPNVVKDFDIYVDDFCYQVECIDRKTPAGFIKINGEQKDSIKKSLQSDGKLNTLRDQFLVISQEKRQQDPVTGVSSYVRYPKNPYFGVGVNLTGEENGTPPIKIGKIFSSKNARFSENGIPVDLEIFNGAQITQIGDPLITVQNLQDVINYFRDNSNIAQFKIVDKSGVSHEISCDKKVFKTTGNNPKDVKGRVYDPANLQKTTDADRAVSGGEHKVEDVNTKNSKGDLVDNSKDLEDLKKAAVVNVNKFIGDESDKVQDELNKNDIFKKVKNANPQQCADFMVDENTESKLGIFKIWNSAKTPSQSFEDVADLISIFGTNPDLQYQVARLWLGEPATNAPEFRDLRAIVSAIDVNTSDSKSRLDFIQHCIKEKAITKVGDVQTLISGKSDEFKILAIRAFFENEVGKNVPADQALELIKSITDEAKKFEVVRSYISSEGGENILAEKVSELMGLVSDREQRSQIALLAIKNNITSSSTSKNPFDLYSPEDIAKLAKNVVCADKNDEKSYQLGIIQEWIKTTKPNSIAIANLMGRFDTDPQFQASIGISYHKIATKENFGGEFIAGDILSKMGADNLELKFAIAKEWIEVEVVSRDSGESNPDSSNAKKYINNLDEGLRFSIVHLCIFGIQDTKDPAKTINPLFTSIRDVETLLGKPTQLTENQKVSIIHGWLATDEGKKANADNVKSLLDLVVDPSTASISLVSEELKFGIVEKWLKEANTKPESAFIKELMGKFKGDQKFQATIANLWIGKKYPTATAPTTAVAVADVGITDIATLVNGIVIKDADTDKEAKKAIRLRIVQKFIELANPDSKSVKTLMGNFKDDPQFQLSIATLYLEDRGTSPKMPQDVLSLMSAIANDGSGRTTTIASFRITIVQKWLESNPKATPKDVGNLIKNIGTNHGIIQSQVAVLYLKHKGKEITADQVSDLLEFVSDESKSSILKKYFQNKNKESDPNKRSEKVEFKDFKNIILGRENPKNKLATRAGGFKKPGDPEVVGQEGENSKNKLRAIKLYFDYEKNAGREILPEDVAELMSDEIFISEQDKLGVVELWASLTQENADKFALISKTNDHLLLSHAQNDINKLPNFDKFVALINAIKDQPLPKLKGVLDEVKKPRDNFILQVASLFVKPREYADKEGKVFLTTRPQSDDGFKDLKLTLPGGLQGSFEASVRGYDKKPSTHTHATKAILVKGGALQMEASVHGRF